MGIRTPNLYKKPRCGDDFDETEGSTFIMVVVVADGISGSDDTDDDDDMGGDVMVFDCGKKERSIECDDAWVDGWMIVSFSYG
jgi:hypothetical protein